ncbi:MAG: hypothetical protein K0R00_462 [Herbinix sp.]|jgi:hypothetical protein|nr:hypothetical protein [Herbinix sp.]
MGSSGSGRFGNYSSEGAGSFLGGGNAKGEISCPLELLLLKLEDIATSEYYLKYHNVPSISITIEVKSEMVNRRLVVIESESELVIGNIPVEYNYLNICIKKGMIYSGVICSSNIKPIPYVVVNLYAK